MRRTQLSAGEARRVALSAQGFAAPRPSRPAARHILAVVRRLGALQLDSVNVLVRSHYLPPFSRLGPYPVSVLDRLVNERHDLIEIDAHQASLVPVELEPLLRTRVQGRFRYQRGWRESIERRRPGYAAVVERTVAERGPVGLADLDEPGRRAKPKASELSVRRRDGQPYAESSIAWGRPSDGKDVLDGLLSEGRLALAGRGAGFERLYDLIERVVPERVRSEPSPASEETALQLVSRATRALGVATVKDLAGYFSLKVAPTRVAVKELVGRDELVPVQVDGWTAPAFMHPDAKAPRELEARALLSPFDSLTWSRERTQRLFGFEFSFEIYVPAAKRRFGYFVLPFLLGDALVGRVDLKADRQRGILLVPGAFSEPGIDVRGVVPALAGSLREMASWLELEGIEIGRRGDLTEKLRRAN